MIYFDAKSTTLNISMRDYFLLNGKKSTLFYFYIDFVCERFSKKKVLLFIIIIVCDDKEDNSYSDSDQLSDLTHICASHISPFSFQCYFVVVVEFIYIIKLEGRDFLDISQTFFFDMKLNQ